MTRSMRFLLGINAPVFALNIIFVVNNPNIYHYVLTIFIDRGLLPDNRLNTALGLLAIWGFLAAAVAQPIWGALSDRTVSRIGARYPYFLLGTFGVFVVLLVLVNVRSWWLLIPAVALLQIFANGVQSPLQALLPDKVPAHQLGIASSLKTLLEVCGIIASGAVVWLFLGTETRPELAALVVSFILLVAIIITMQTAPHDANDPAHYPPTRARLNVSDRYVRRFGAAANSLWWARITMARQNIHHITRQRPLQWWLIGRFFFFAAFSTIGKFAITYLTDVFGYSPEEARAIQGVALLITGSLIIVATLVAGMFADRIGRKRMAAVGGGVSAGAALSLMLMPSFEIAVMLICIMGIGASIFFSAGWALITYIVPPRKAAFYLGFLNLATTLGGAFGMLGGYLVDVVNDWTTNPATGYNVLFLMTALSFAIGAITTSRVKEITHR